MTSLNLALLLHRQFAKYLPEMPPQLSVRPSVDDGSQRELTSNVVTDGRHIFSVPFWAPRSAVPSLHVVSDIGHLSAPCMMVALAGIVHDREAAAGHEHNRA
jgi:hypothetical protein